MLIHSTGVKCWSNFVREASSGTLSVVSVSNLDVNFPLEGKTLSIERKLRYQTPPNLKFKWGISKISSLSVTFMMEYSIPLVN